MSEAPPPGVVVRNIRAIAKRLGIEPRDAAEVEALKTEVAPEALLEQISEQRAHPQEPAPTGSGRSSE